MATAGICGDGFVAADVKINNITTDDGAVNDQTTLTINGLFNERFYWWGAQEGLKENDEIVIKLVKSDTISEPRTDPLDECLDGMCCNPSQSPIWTRHGYAFFAFTLLLSSLGLGALTFLVIGIIWGFDKGTLYFLITGFCAWVFVPVTCIIAEWNDKKGT